MTFINITVLLQLSVLFLTACQPKRQIQLTYNRDTQISTYTNTGLIKNAADPFVFRDDDGTYFLYHTGKGFKVHKSIDLVNWKKLGKSMPEGSKWAVKHFWAPEVFKYHEQYFMHYTAQTKDESKKIGLAVSDNPEGPFVDLSNGPFYETMPKGVIDSHIFIDGDKVFLYYSNAMTTNQVGNQRYSEIWAVELEPDFSGIKGTPVRLIKPEQDWEYSSRKGDFWNEGAVLFKKNDTYYLMYSANCYCGERYAVGYATSSAPTGPFTKYDKNPILSYDPYRDKVSGPGHHSLTFSPDSREMFIVYHSHMDLIKKGGQRQINIDRMGVREDGTLYVNGPTVTPQPYPSSEANESENIILLGTVTATFTKDGHRTEALTDGEFSMYPRFKNYEWVANNRNERVSVTTKWSIERRIDEIWFYNSIDQSRQVKNGRIEFNNGVEIKNVLFKTGPGEATIVNMKDRVVADGFTIYLMGEGQEIALSEIMVMGKE